MCTYGFVIEVQVSGNYRVREEVTQAIFLTSSPECFRVWGLGSLSMYFVRPAKKDMRFGPDIAGETFSISGPKLQYPRDEACGQTAQLATRGCPPQFLVYGHNTQNLVPTKLI